MCDSVFMETVHPGADRPPPTSQELHDRLTELVISRLEVMERLMKEVGLIIHPFVGHVHDFIGLPSMCGRCGAPEPDGSIVAITDGYQTWYPCDKPPFKDGACRLEVVRIGKVQCDCDSQGMPCLDCNLPMFDRWAIEVMNVPFAIAQHEVVNTFGHDNGMRLQCGEQVKCNPELCDHPIPPRRCGHICLACEIDEGNG